VDHFFSTDTS
jgi:phosphoglucomutase/phosphopentomutase